MKLHPEQIPHANTVTGYGESFIEINAERLHYSILVMPAGILEDWKVNRFESLTPEHFAAIVRHAPEIVLFGSGSRLRFPAPQLMRPLIEVGIGFETMDTRAACRTYNVLMAEGRQVAAALLLEPNTLEKR